VGVLLLGTVRSEPTAAAALDVGQMASFVDPCPAAALPVPQVRTQTLVKNAIVQVDANPFRQWYQQHYGVELGLKKNAEAEVKEDVKVRGGAQGHSSGEGW
jgi:hypothetical protein